MLPHSQLPKLHIRSRINRWQTNVRCTAQLPQVRVFCSTIRYRESEEASTLVDSVKAIPYGELSIGVPTEVRTGERRVAVTPQNAALLLKKGFKEVLVEHGAGFNSQFDAHVSPLPNEHSLLP